MNSRMPDHWITVDRPAAEGGRIYVHVPRTCASWAETGLAYWRGALSELELVRRHDWGGRVERGRAGPDDALCYFKRFTPTSPRYLYKVQRARHTVLHEERIRRLGFGAPETVCLLERRRLGLVIESAVISLAHPDAHKVSFVLNHNAGDLIRSIADKRMLLRHVAEIVARWHNAGLFHGDLHLGNLFCRKANGSFEFFWLDNEEGRHYRKLPFRKRVHDLAHIVRQRHNITITDRMRLWKVYAQTSDLSEHAQRRVLRAVSRKSRAFWKKKGWA